MYGWAYIWNDKSVSKLVGLYMGGLIFGGLWYIIAVKDMATHCLPAFCLNCFVQDSLG